MIITTEKQGNDFYFIINTNYHVKSYYVGSRENILRLLNIDLKALDNLYLKDKYKIKYKGLSYKIVKALLLKHNRQNLNKDVLHKLYKQDNLYLRRLMEDKLK
jgi:hypothetical protein